MVRSRLGPALPQPLVFHRRGGVLGGRKTRGEIPSGSPSGGFPPPIFFIALVGGGLDFGFGSRRPPPGVF